MAQKLQKLRTYEYKTDNGIYVSEMVKVDKGIYNFKTTLNNKPVAEEKKLKLQTALILEAHIRTVIKKYEKDNGVEAPEVVEMEEELEELEEIKEEVMEVEELKEENDKLDELLEEELDDDEEDNEIESIEELAQEQFKKETGLNAITKKGSLRKDYTKWKKKNWD